MPARLVLLFVAGKLLEFGVETAQRVLQGVGDQECIYFQGVGFSGDLGLVFGPVLVGLVADLFGYRSPFMLLPIVTATGVLLAVTKLRRSPLESPVLARS